MSGTDIHIPTLATARLTLRAAMPSDFEDFAAFRMSERARGVGGPYNRTEAYYQFCELIGHWHIRGYGRWMVADRETDVPYGVVGLFFPEDWPEPEIAWALFEGGEGRGIASEAAVAARTYAYDTLGWSTLISCVMPDNVRSIALAERLGAVPDGVFPHPELGPLVMYRHPAPEALQ